MCSMESALTFPFDSKTTMMYKSKSLVELLIWHKHRANIDGLIWSVPDSKSWNQI
jgi:hypothetical protein